MQQNTRMIQTPPSAAVRVASSAVPALARAWLRSQRHDAAAARLRAVAPDPLPRPDPAALASALGLRPRDAINRAALLDGLSRAARTCADARVARALAEAVDEVQATLYP